ncbi:MAG: helix-turn-helix transcriptional regulator [Atopobiaceae bacterium]|nr:helix-turn-helix transcriptional regulator [Atopobiaceae bacterium]MBR1828949.1 helix-turn-helix transcriptional regulator [Atopobiaceae bacterium]
MIDQQSIGAFLRELRQAQGITQEQLAAELGVSNRSVSRWETGRTMPDFDLLIELAKRYDVSVDELLAAERNSSMDTQTEESLYRIADYTNNERDVFTKRLHLMFLAGIVAFAIYFGLDWFGMIDTPLYDFIAGMCLGICAGMLIVGAIFTSAYAGRIRAAKMRLLHRGQA